MLCRCWRHPLGRMFTLSEPRVYRAHAFDSGRMRSDLPFEARDISYEHSPTQRRIGNRS
jgi:hypothetical protein